jgi:thioester reductase-like protein
MLCLVRPGGNAQDRLRAQLLDAGITAADVDARIRVVQGDLSHPSLGLGNARFTTLGRSVDAICHAGAAVNWVYSYGGLRAANVSGTLEMLRLACIGGTPFHFISSLSVCYATTISQDHGLDEQILLDETCDPLAHLRGVHLGYAQTKIVGEALVREAGARGLPIRIYRPSLISGHSLTGAYNRDDLVSALVRGCVHMGMAPDLDWTLDCQPVDVVAHEILALSAERGPVFHLGHERPRHWRECVLWMRLYGYPIRLVSYHRWLRQLERETDGSSPGAASHPLRPLRSFFLDRPDGARGLTRPELFEETRRTHATGARTDKALSSAHVVCPPLDAALLDTYFAAFQRAGDLPLTNHRRPAAASLGVSSDTWLDARFFSDVLRANVIGATTLGSGSDHSIVSELTTWRSGRTTGLFRVRLEIDESGAHVIRNVVVKSKAADVDVIAVGEAMAGLIDPEVSEAYGRWSDRVGFTASHTRELAIYRQRDARFIAHAPALLGSVDDERSGRWILVLEDLGRARLLDSAGRIEAWTPADIGTAIDGLSAVHAVWYGREAELGQRPWIGHVQSTRSMIEMSDLWSALAAHAGPAFASWADPDMASLHRRIIGTVDRWWPRLAHGPRTLIHHDFNPRNICLRESHTGSRLCAYDWELATLGAPQRDLAEFLCFVLPPDVSARDARAWIERHRISLERETGTWIGVEEWQAGFRAALGDLLINRLATYALVHRIRRQTFLPRVVRTWRRLYEFFPLELEE